MERKKIVIPNGQKVQPTRPSRGQSILPTSPSRPESASPPTDAPKILKTPVSTSDLHTQSRSQRPRFDQRFTRITVYLENETYHRVRNLYDNRSIDTLTAMFNAAVESYLSTHFGK